MSHPSFLAIADVAHRLGVSHSTVRAYLSRDQMPAPTGRIGRSPWWSAEAIEPWLAERVGPRFTEAGRCEEATAGVWCDTHNARWEHTQPQCLGADRLGIDPFAP